MRRISVLVVVLAILGLATAVPATAEPEPGRYIVVLKASAGDPGSVAGEHAREHAAQVSAVFRTALRGYAATIPEHRLDGIRSDERVAYVERDLPVTIAHHRNGHDKGGDDPAPPPPPPPPGDCPGSQVLPWGIDRVEADASVTAAANDCSGAIAGVDVYVIDTGIADHSDLNSTQAVNFAGGPNKDCNGHGTHVAGTIGAIDNTTDVVGVAPGVSLIGVKVLGCSGGGTTSGVIGGIDYVTQQAVSSGRPSVANMSLGGGASTSLDSAVANSVAGGVFYALAAGNEGTNACTRSPARVGASLSGALTAGATDVSNNDPSWSNFGSCVEIWAPGVSILSTSSSGGTLTLSGTSMAAPHVAGAAALWLSLGNGGGGSAAEGAILDADTSPGTFSNNGAPINLLSVGGF